MLTNELIEAQQRDADCDPNSVLLSGRTEETLDEKDKIIRDAFCLEYIKDFNGKHAMARIGVTNPRTQNSKSCIWLREPYVQKRIRELVRDLKETDVVQRNEVLARLWKEANDDDNEGSVRVAALAHIGKMLGMRPEKDSDNTPKLPQNVLLMPIVNLEQWASQSAVMQTQLLQSARERGSPAMPLPRVPVIEAESA